MPAPARGQLRVCSGRIIDRGGVEQHLIQDYFDAGAELVWYIIPESKKIYVYTSPDESKAYKGREMISAAPVALDFQFVVTDLFDN